jgi:hypothetical protein
MIESYSRVLRFYAKLPGERCAGAGQSHLSLLSHSRIITLSLEGVACSHNPHILESSNTQLDTNCRMCLRQVSEIRILTVSESLHVRIPRWSLSSSKERFVRCISSQGVWRDEFALHLIGVGRDVNLEAASFRDIMKGTFYRGYRRLDDDLSSES